MDGQGSHRLTGPSRQTIRVGPYRLAVIPSSRGRSAIVAALQGFYEGKQIEIPRPPPS